MAEEVARSRRTDIERPRAVVVGVQLPEVDEREHDSSLAEIERLAMTLGLRPVGRVTQKRPHLAPGAVLGEGKLRELAGWTGGSGVVPSGAVRKRRKIDQEVDESGDDEFEFAERESDSEFSSADDASAGRATTSRADVVLVDHDLTPSQARNLERATGAEVLDRTSIILNIFQRHARTREAKMQVEIARLGYLAPRLREVGAGGDRQRGGIGGKGAGESAVELDRRKIRDRIAELRAELVTVRRESDVRRTRRVATGDTVALVGYTNAGKSSWMRLLTGGEVYVADELFATLDTTVRALHPESKPRILVSDTVGFIKKLPHDLVASFRSTLEEARDASLMLHVVDASDPAFRQQFDVTKHVLRELDADRAPSILLLNKIDCLDQEERTQLSLEFPDAMQVSAREPRDVARVHRQIVDFFRRDMEEAEFYVPYVRQAGVGLIHESAQVESEEFDETGTRLRVLAPRPVLDQLRSRLRGLLEA